jgi:hypothetical protein
MWEHAALIGGFFVCKFVADNLLQSVEPLRLGNVSARWADFFNFKTNDKIYQLFKVEQFYKKVSCTKKLLSITSVGSHKHLLRLKPLDLTCQTGSVASLCHFA